MGLECLGFTFDWTNDPSTIRVRDMRKVIVILSNRGVAQVREHYTCQVERGSIYDVLQVQFNASSDASRVRVKNEMHVVLV
jgi:hypothetical protein